MGTKFNAHINDYWRFRFAQWRMSTDRVWWTIQIFGPICWLAVYDAFVIMEDYHKMREKPLAQIVNPFDVN